MVMMMMNNECEKSLLEYVRKSTPPPFLLKTYMLVEDPATDEIISWNNDGSAFVVWQPAEFARDLLPTLFKHSNFSSFVRQLNTYGFRKIATSRWEFSNDMFGKGKKDLLCEIRRRKAWTNKSSEKRNHNHHHHHQASDNQATNHNKDTQSDEDQQSQRSSSTNSSSSHEFNVLVDENKRLKKENGFLSCELVTMKKKCKDLLDLVALYSSNNNINAGNDHHFALKKPDQIDDDNDDDEVVDDQRPKLFGVRLEVQKGGGNRKRKFGPIQHKAAVCLFQSCK
ncbi:OLC1v1036777C1 [Oldenlandia corymbosa var. corymbosa]|uniref:OLC1v1036777C1 n=1 Tax=Oldenlandia corymbosa var. corymbosa TaxID=529605 RepID=A0AAV1CWR8_OLDCO|nr:OLC1v1036777C1 [Oldenlandia corymbosa var. corymbosa]